MCTAASQSLLPDFLTSTEGHEKYEDGKPRPIKTAKDIDLGEGMAAAASASILSRRERIRRAVEGDGDPNEHITRNK